MHTTRVALAIAVATLLVAASPARAETKCHLRFHLEGWSAFYKTSHGGGRVTCDGGESAPVAISTKGGGFTFGKQKIVNGEGTFSPVSGIGDIFGDYASAEAHAGAGASAGAGVVTKGDVSLALSGEGHGVDLGFAFGKFTIARARVRHREPARSPAPKHGEAY